MQQLELDLRDNLGGLFMEGVEVARLFLPGTIKSQLCSLRDRSLAACRLLRSRPQQPWPCLHSLVTSCSDGLREQPASLGLQPGVVVLRLPHCASLPKDS